MSDEGIYPSRVDGKIPFSSLRLCARVELPRTSACVWLWHLTLLNIAKMRHRWGGSRGNASLDSLLGLYYVCGLFLVVVEIDSLT